MNCFDGVYPLNMSFYFYGWALHDKTQECNCCSNWQVGWGKGDGSDQLVSDVRGMQGYHPRVCVDVWMGWLLGQSMNHQHFMFMWHWYVMAITWGKNHYASNTIFHLMDMVINPFEHHLFQQETRLSILWWVTAKQEALGELQPQERKNLEEQSMAKPVEEFHWELHLNFQNGDTPMGQTAATWKAETTWSHPAGRESCCMCTGMSLVCHWNSRMFIYNQWWLAWSTMST